MKIIVSMGAGLMKIIVSMGAQLIIRTVFLKSKLD